MSIEAVKNVGYTAKAEQYLLHSNECPVYDIKLHLIVIEILGNEEYPFISITHRSTQTLFGLV